MAYGLLVIGAVGVELVGEVGIVVSYVLVGAGLGREAYELFLCTPFLAFEAVMCTWAASAVIVHAVIGTCLAREEGMIVCRSYFNDERCW